MDEIIEKRIQRFVHEYKNDEKLVLPQYGVNDFGLLKRIYDKGCKYELDRNYHKVL